MVEYIPLIANEEAPELVTDKRAEFAVLAAELDCIVRAEPEVRLFAVML